MIDLGGVRTRGGLAYGLELAQMAIPDSGIRVAPWVFVPLTDLSGESLLEVSSRLGPMVLRWSSAKDGEFTANSRRGDKTRQINAVPINQTVSQLSAIAENARRVTPLATVGAVLQQSLDWSAGCLFDIEVCDEGVDLELRTNAARILLRRDCSGLNLEKIGEDRRLPGLADAQAVIDRVIEMVARLPRSRTGWHIEGAWIPERDHFDVLQLRPVPDDRPSARSSTVASGSVASTRFVWGAFDLDVDLSSRSAVSSDGLRVVTVLRAHSVTELEETIVANLAGQRTVLLLNRISGFRLTHEPYNLPEADLRSRFLSVHVPALIQRSFRVLSDGDTAYFWEI